MATLSLILATVLTFLTTTFAIPTIPKSAIIAIEDTWGGANTSPRNKTFAIPLDKPWNHAPFSDIGSIYLIGSKGNVTARAISCMPYWTKKDGQGFAGLWLTSTTPSSPNLIAGDLDDARLKLTCAVITR